VHSAAAEAEEALVSSVFQSAKSRLKRLPLRFLALVKKNGGVDEK
jgi:hypothetical protein